MRNLFFDAEYQPVARELRERITGVADYHDAPAHGQRRQQRPFWRAGAESPARSALPGGGESGRQDSSRAAARGGEQELSLCDKAILLASEPPGRMANNLWTITATMTTLPKSTIGTGAASPSGYYRYWNSWRWMTARRDPRFLICAAAPGSAKALAARDYKVTGVDGSEQMLRLARQNAPKASFHCADARSFDLSTNFALVLSTYDSLNHLLTLEDLASVFRNVFRHLQSGASSSST